LRNASGWIPNWPAILLIAPVLVAGSRLASTANFTARSINSGEYFLGAGMTPILPAMRASEKPGTIHQAWITDYNAERTHASLGERTPAEARAEAVQHKTAG
jgi:hypothetical protein